jgi:DNA-directed RNA polymerase specialized sigma24 family protein
MVRAPADYSDNPMLVEVVRRATRRPLPVRLPAQQQTVITLRDIEGLTSSEVCDLLDPDPGEPTCSASLRPRRVRRRLEDYYTGVDA